MERLSTAGADGDAVTGPGCRSVLLHALLDAQGVVGETRGDMQDEVRYVLVSTSSGRRALFSLSELDTAARADAPRLLLPCTTGGGARDATLRLRAPGDATAARNLDGVRSIVVVVAP
ncbi:MAG TPA: hypothetical protein VLK29_05150 [Luteimonas sp.]|nr:hypothetical protein [Luteimonas sp.]